LLAFKIYTHEEPKYLRGVGLADVVDGKAVSPAVLPAPRSKISHVLHDPSVLLGHGEVVGLLLLRGSPGKSGGLGSRASHVTLQKESS